MKSLRFCEKMNRFACLAFLLAALLWPARAEWKVKSLLYNHIEGIDTALICPYLSISPTGYLVSAQVNDRNWLWQMEANGEVCRQTGTPYYYIKNVNTGLYMDGTDRPVQDKRKAWLYTIISALDTVYNTHSIMRDQLARKVEQNDSVYTYFWTPTGDTLKTWNDAVLVHLSFDDDSIRAIHLGDIYLAYDDGESLALDSLLAL